MPKDYREVAKRKLQKNRESKTKGGPISKGSAKRLDTQLDKMLEPGKPS